MNFLLICVCDHVEDAGCVLHDDNDSDGDDEDNNGDDDDNADGSSENSQRRFKYQGVVSVKVGIRFKDLL